MTCSLVDVTVADGSESERYSRGEHAVNMFLSESVTYFCAESWQCECIGVTVGDAGITHHHESSCKDLGGFVPGEVFKWTFGYDVDFDGDAVMVFHLDGVGIHFFVFQFVGLAFSGGGAYDESLGVLTMLDFCAGGVVEGHLLREASGFLAVGTVVCPAVGSVVLLVLCVISLCFRFTSLGLGCGLGILAGCVPSVGVAFLCVAAKSFFCISEELPLLIEGLEIQATIDVDGSLGAGGVAK